MHQDERCRESLSCSMGSNVSFNGGRHGNNGRPKVVVKNDASSNALIVVMARIKGWMFSSKMGRFSDATFTLPNW